MTAPFTIPALGLFHNHQALRIRDSVLILAHSQAAFRSAVFRAGYSPSGDPNPRDSQ
jgi:hypothetical protein